MDIFSTGFSSTTMLADVAAAVQSTVASLGGVITLVIGIILTFILLPKVIGLFRHAGKATSK